MPTKGLAGQGVSNGRWEQGAAGQGARREESRQRRVLTGCVIVNNHSGYSESGLITGAGSSGEEQ